MDYWIIDLVQKRNLLESPPPPPRVFNHHNFFKPISELNNENPGWLLYVSSFHSFEAGIANAISSFKWIKKYYLWKIGISQIELFD